MKPDQLIVALDIPTDKTDQFTDTPEAYFNWAVDLIKTLYPTGCLFKVGMQLYAAGGLKGVKKLGISGPRLMLDLKLWDTPDTVAKTTLMLCKALKPKFFTIPLPYNHPSATAAIKILKENGLDTIILGVSVLTSMDRTAVWEASDSLYGGEDAAQRAVAHFAALGSMMKLEGLICSPHEVGVLKPTIGQNFIYVTPGVRPAGSNANDQQRIATPAFAIESGADYLVVGRPITEAPDPRTAAEAIIASA